MNNTNKNGANPFTAAVVGAAVGAAAVVLSNKENREKIKSKAQEMMKKGGKSLKEAQSKVEEAKEAGKEKLAESIDKATKKVNKMKETTLG